MESESDATQAPYVYGNGYILLPLHLPILDRLPEAFAYDGHTFFKKEEFHVSLVCTKKIIPLVAQARGTSEARAEKNILSLFNRFISAAPITFANFVPEFRLATRDRNESIVILCEMYNLQDFFEQLNAYAGIEIPSQPAHITLYTVVPNKGIGITDPEVMANYLKVELPELSRILL